MTSVLSFSKHGARRSSFWLRAPGRGVPNEMTCDLSSSLLFAPRFLIQKSLSYPCIGVDPPVAEKGPVTSRLFDAREVDFRKDQLLSVRRGLFQHHAEGIRDE